MKASEYFAGSGGDKPKPKYKDFKRSLPANLSGTPERKYAMKRYWKDEGRPKDFKEAQGRDRPMFTEVYHPEEGKSVYHAVSTSEKTGKMYKPKRHKSTYMELEGYRDSPEMKEYRENNKVVSRGRFLKYVPKTERDKAHPERNDKRVEKYIGKSKRAEARYEKKEIKKKGR